MAEPDAVAGAVEAALAPYVDSGELPGGALCIQRRGDVRHLGSVEAIDPLVQAASRA